MHLTAPCYLSRPRYNIATTTLQALYVDGVELLDPLSLRDYSCVVSQVGSGTAVSIDVVEKECTN